MTKGVTDWSGWRFGKWTAKSYAGNYRWNCICDCGAEGEVLTGNLVGGISTSCRSCVNTRHGLRHTRAYRSWDSMIQRCLNPNSSDYPKWGGIGVTVCERWRKFENFFTDMGERPEGKSLDRYPDPYGNYEPRNCRWATSSEQNKNKRVRSSF